ncbi:mitogen-activated protein kinase [Novymonas esmeraldas]|uniref:cyclin-dependent kinase n=1 Tax=Novymonas esmeraldas TaxID=1808958 RepID=A0AAW0EP17_9TRYP
MEAYETLGILGEGTYGVVVKARSRVTGKLVAIKRFKQTEQDDHVRKTSTREVRMLQLLRHPNVIRLEDVFRREGKLYLVFEFIDHTILQLLETTTRGLSHRELRRYTYQLLRGIEFCHKHNVIHRDVKPENVLIDESGMLKLCDFGFARQMSAKGKYTDYVATRWYRAPELLVGDVSYGKPVDVWALGCMFAELSDGQPLFPGESDLDQLCLILQTCGPVPARMVSIFEHNPLYNGISFPHTGILYTLRERYHRESDDWLGFLSSCLHPDPAQRLTCTELMELPYFNRDGFRERYEAELRAATGLPQLRTTPITSAPSPTRRRVSGQTAGVDITKADTIPSPKNRLSSEIVSPKLQTQLSLGSTNSTSGAGHLSKAAPDATAHEASAATTAASKSKAPIAQPPGPSPSHASSPSDQSVQLPMILPGNSERAAIMALAEYVHPTSNTAATAVASSTVGLARTGDEGPAPLDLLAYSCGAVAPLAPPSALASPVSNTPGARDRKSKRQSTNTDGELQLRGGVCTSHGADADTGKRVGGGGGGGRPLASATLPPGGTRSGDGDGGGYVRGAGRASELTNSSLPLVMPMHGDAGASAVATTAAALGKDGGETAVPIHGGAMPPSPRKPTPAAAAACPPSLTATRVAPLAERLPDLSAPSLHLPRPAELEQPQPRSPPSAEASMMSSVRGRARNPLAAPPAEHDSVPRGRSNPAEAGGAAKARRGLPISNSSAVATAAHVASEVKRRKLAKRKKDSGRALDHVGTSPDDTNALRRSLPSQTAEVDAVVHGSKLAASPSLSHAVELQQQQHLMAPEASRSHAADPYTHSVGAGPSAAAAAATHHRNIDAQGPLPRKERRSKPLAGSTPVLQGSDTRSRAPAPPPASLLPPQPPLEGSAQPDGGAAQRATATLLALSALRSIAGPQTGNAGGGEADKYNYAAHARTHGGEVISPAMGGGGDGPSAKGSTTNRARRPLGVYTLHNAGREGEEAETARRVQEKTRGSQGAAASSIAGTDRSTTSSSYHATGSMHGPPYAPFARASKLESELAGAGAPVRPALRKLRKKTNDPRGSGATSTATTITVKSSSTARTSIGSVRQLPAQHAKEREEGGPHGDGPAHPAGAATAAAPYTSR